MVEDCDPVDVFALLDDEYARSILAATSQQSMTATELSDQCQMSISTIYRRTDSLEACGLIETETELDADGDHRRRYTATLEELTVELSEGQFSVSLSTGFDSREFADAFTDLWEGL